MFGVVFIATMLILALFVPNPTPFQYLVFRVVLSLAAGGVAAMIPGFIELEVPNWLRSGGALAVFVIVFFWNPAQLVTTPPTQVRWDGGETLQTVVERLRGHYRQGTLAEEIRFASANEESIARLWVSPATYKRPNWGELFQLVAQDHPCLLVTIREPGRLIELDKAAELTRCGEWSVCAPRPCEPR